MAVGVTDEDTGSDVTSETTDRALGGSPGDWLGRGSPASGTAMPPRGNASAGTTVRTARPARARAAADRPAAAPAALGVGAGLVIGAGPDIGARPAAGGGQAPQGPPAVDDQSRTDGAGGNNSPAEGRAHPHRPAAEAQPPRRWAAAVPRWRPTPWPTALALVALAYALTQLLLVIPHLAHVLGWDETVYISQVDPRTPAAFFSAPRSRGISLLVAPIVAVNGSVPVLRITLALLSAAALYAAYRTWRPLLGPAITALGALLFAGLWITQISGPEAMPNLWVALGSIAAVGWFLRAPMEEAYARWWLAACLAGVALMRAPDAAWLALPLLATAVFVRSHRRTLAYLLGGVAAGATEWVVEAYVRFGGVPQRLHVSGATEGGMHPHLNFLNAWRSLNGPELCRPCTGPVHHPELTLWWLALPVVVAIAVVVALRDRGCLRDRTLLPTAVALSLSVPYLLLLSYSAPRFLLPAYALLALPLAGLLNRIASVRRSLTVAVACLVVLQLAVQFAVLQNMSVRVAATGQRYRTAAEDLRALGLRAPCLVTGPHALPVAYDLGCASAQTKSNNRSTTVSSVLERAKREPTAALTAHGHRPPHYARDWTPRTLPGTRGWVAWLAP